MQIHLPRHRCRPAFQHVGHRSGVILFFQGIRPANVASVCENSAGLKLGIAFSKHVLSKRGFRVAIQLSASNVRDFIRAKGIGVPIVIPPGDLKAFILDVAKEWSFNTTKLPKGLTSSCARAGSEAAEAAIRLIIPSDLDPAKKLPRYLDQQAMRAGAAAAENAIRPWVLGSAPHTNPTDRSRV